MSLFSAMAGSVVSAQDATGRIVGTVTDPSDSPIVGTAICQIQAVCLGLKITVTNIGTDMVVTTTTDSNGYYQVLSLPIGEYQVVIELPGFRKQVFEHQKLQINQTLRMDAQLTLGLVSESVEVNTQVPNVETISETIGTTVIGETIQRAPLNGRNVLELAALQPGVTESNADSSAAGRYSIAGGRSDSVTYLLDGGLNNNLINNGVVLNPNPETIAEFRILESNYSAEYGRNGGGIISVVTKSGTNEWHGSAFDYLRNNALNANPFFNKNVPGAELPRPILKRNQFGGTLGGPITIPHVVNGKDRFFFFVGYQGQRLSGQASSGLNSVFTPSQLQGDFSGGMGTGGTCPNADPGVSAFLLANPYYQSNTSFATCAVIDPTKIDAVAQKYIAAGLLPTNSNGQAQYYSPFTNNANELTMKFDLLLTQRDKVSAILGGFRNPSLQPFPNWPTVPGFANNFQNNNYFGNLSYSHTFSSALVNEFHLFIQRNNYLQYEPSGANKSFTASALGVGITPDDPTGPPILNFNNFAMVVGYAGNGPSRLVNNTFGFTDTVSYIHGRHTWKMGGGISAYQNNTNFDFYVNGEFDFYGTGTGNAFADFLFGIPTDMFQYPQAPSNIRSKSYYGFLQDEWHLTKRFTLNLGVRYEYNSPKEDTEGRTYSIIPGVTHPSTVFTDAPIGMLFPGDPGAPTGVNFPNTKNWAPRVGFAWDPKGDGKTSLRGGFGLFYDILKAEDNFQFNGQPPFFSSGFAVFTPSAAFITSGADFLENPWNYANPPVNPFPSKPPDPNVNFLNAGFLPINSGGAVYIVDPHLKTPYTYQYNLSLQREVERNTVVEASYVGNSSHGLTSLQDINPFVLGTTDRILNLTQGNSSCLDYSGNSTSGVSSSATCSYAGLPEFKNVANASYNSFQLSLTRQITDSRIGRTYFIVAYTFGHNIDNASGFQQRNKYVPSYDSRLFRASSDQDIRHRITISGGWDLPFDRMWSSGPKRLTQGWSLFPIFTWRTGLPYDVFATLPEQYIYSAEGPSGAGDPSNTHANIVGGTVTQYNPGTARTLTNPNNGNSSSTGNYLFNPASLSNAQCGDNNNPFPCTPSPTLLPADSQVVANPALATYGTLPRNFLRGPGYINLDMAFSKTTAINERVKLEFRGEFFNIANHANFLNPNAVNNYQGFDTTNQNPFSSSGPGTNPTSQLFGQVTSTYDPRIIQLALRLTF
jgi:outer membrane receptor protein involved in Fe transport